MLTTTGPLLEQNVYFHSSSITFPIYMQVTGQQATLSPYSNPSDNTRKVLLRPKHHWVEM